MTREEWELRLREFARWISKDFDFSESGENIVEIAELDYDSVREAFSSSDINVKSDCLSKSGKNDKQRGCGE